MMEEIPNILRQVKFDWPKDYIIRFLYVKLAPCFQRDLNYFMASDEERMRQFNLGFINNIPYVVCATISDFYVEIFKKYGIRAERVPANSADIPLFALVVEGDYGLYFLDPLNDLFRNQYGLKPIYFGIIPRYKTINVSHPNLISLSYDYVDAVDEALGFQSDYVSLHSYLNNLHENIAPRNCAYKYFGIPRNGLAALTQRKLELYNEELINIGNVKGPFERALLYAYLNGKLLDRCERKNVIVKIVRKTDSNYISVSINGENEEIKYEEHQQDKKYVLTRIS